MNISTAAKKKKKFKGGGGFEFVFHFVNGYRSVACRSKLPKKVLGYFFFVFINSVCGKFVITHIEKNYYLTHTYVDFVYILIVLPKTSVGHDSNRDVSPLRKI